MSKAFLVLDDGRIFEGKSWGATGRTFGEAVSQLEGSNASINFLA